VTVGSREKERGRRTTKRDEVEVGEKKRKGAVGGVMRRRS
jgi:hypothetical protein